MTRKSNTVARRAQIIRAMSEVMAEQGYDGATIQAVAARAGLVPGLVHYHFKSKQEILLSLIQFMEENLLQRVEARKNDKDPDRDLKAFIDATLALGEDSDQILVRCWIIIGAEALRQSEVAEVYRQVISRQIELLEQRVRRCLTAQSRSTKSSLSLALGIHAAIEGAFRLLVSAPEMTRSEAGFAAPTVLTMAQGAIAGQPKA
ncbi:MAG TPA: TetR/AcrR family transcriptional regulator [Chroococcales cyanobacterium]